MTRDVHNFCKRARGRNKPCVDHPEFLYQTEKNIELSCARILGMYVEFVVMKREID
jgi:hypothetical protein